jgi:hypothetical protein
MILKNTVIAIIGFLVFYNGYSQTKLYVHPNAESYASNTQTIAVLPFRVQVKLRPKELKDFTSDQIVQMNKDEALDIQKGMHSWFLTRKQRGEFSGTIQNPTQTNALLIKAGIDVHLLEAYTPQEIGKILNVDCVVMGNFETSKPMSNGAALVGLVLIGFAGATQSATCNMDFYDTRDGELVVNYFKQVKGSIGSNSEDLINILMRKVTRRIPYTTS